MWDNSTDTLCIRVSTCCHEHVVKSVFYSNLPQRFHTSDNNLEINGE